MEPEKIAARRVNPIWVAIAFCSTILIALAIPFSVQLLHSKHGEIAGALGGVIGGIFGGLLAAYAGYVAVTETLLGQAAADKQRSEEELAALRLALRTEVGMVAQQCIMEFQDWRTSKNEAVQNRKPPATAIMPTLHVYMSNASQIGRLNRDEIVAIVGFAGTLADIRTYAEDMQSRPQTHDDKERMMLMLSNACGKAAECLKAMPAPDAEADRTFIAHLNLCFQETKRYRAEAAKRYGFDPPKETA